MKTCKTNSTSMECMTNQSFLTTCAKMFPWLAEESPWLEPEREVMACKKLLYIADLLRQICAMSDIVTELKNHPINDFQEFLGNWAGCYCLRVNEPLFLLSEIEDFYRDFWRTENMELRSKVQRVYHLMREVVDENYDFELPHWYKV